MREGKRKRRTEDVTNCCAIAANEERVTLTIRWFVSGGWFQDQDFEGRLRLRFKCRNRNRPRTYPRDRMNWVYLNRALSSNSR
jgi:hypothetical protein